MEEYISLLEEYLYWAENRKTYDIIISQLFISSIDFSYKVSLLKHTLSILRNDYPDTWQRLQFTKNIDLNSTTGN